MFVKPILNYFMLPLDSIQTTDSKPLLCELLKIEDFLSLATTNPALQLASVEDVYEEIINV